MVNPFFLDVFDSNYDPVKNNIDEVMTIFLPFYKSSLTNSNIDVLLAGSIEDVNMYLEGNTTKYKNVIFADHGAGYTPSTQVLGENRYSAKKMTENNLADFQSFSKNNISSDGNVVLLGCFTAAHQYQGPDYLLTFSSIVDRPVYGNQGESYIVPENAFKGGGIGGPPMALRPGDKKPTYYQTAVDNAGKWSVAKPDRTINMQIGNVSLDPRGNPISKLSVPPLKPENKPIADWKSILYKY